MTETALDRAYLAMQDAPQDGRARLQFYERLADGELFLLLSEEATGEVIQPETFDIQGEKVVLVFDTEERLASFMGKPAPFAALSGRLIAQMLAPEGLGMGVNFDVAPSAILIPPQAVSWLQEILSNSPEAVEAQVAEFMPPSGLPEVLVQALDVKLATAAGLARWAYLAGTKSDTGVQSHMLGFVAALPEAQSALAQAVAEALSFSGIEAGALDVGFFAANDPVAAQLAQVGLRFDLPQIEGKAPQEITAPGRDPQKPPILR